MGLAELIQKYSVQGPRYTSYPTAPHWKEAISSERYAEYLGKVDLSRPIALYVHIPFCEALCYYCGCNIQINKDHGRADSYLQALKKELAWVASQLPAGVRVGQISWGGGTPTFLSENAIAMLQEWTLEKFPLADGAEVSIEVDPRVTTFSQLKVLRSVGFNRVSLGVQDFNAEVQQAINREQTYQQTAEILGEARRLGFTGVNFDFMYGLPLQTPESFRETVRQILELRPDRIALYNYAHLPDKIPHQKILNPYSFPDAHERVSIFCETFERLLGAGYESIGMDHFALKEDELYRSIERGELYRNFMGYTVKKGGSLIGLGASAIGEVAGGFFQNVRSPKDYEEAVNSRSNAVFRGCLLTEEDVERKWIIENILCNFEISGESFQKRFGTAFKGKYAAELSRLSEFVSEGILRQTEDSFRVTDLGRVFVRNLAMIFDAYLPLSQTQYSRTV